MRTIYTDGLKNIELPSYPDSAWTFYTEAPTDTDEKLYGVVSAVYRAVNMTAEAVASLPFALVKGEQDFDVYDKWENKIGFMPDPFQLIRLWRMSLFMTNSAYGFMESGRGAKNLRYIVANTINPVADAQKGLTAFKRSVGQQTIEYPYEQGSIKNKIVPIYWLDHTTELLPSKNTEFKACMNAAGILYYTDYFVRDFFKRGGIIPSIIGIKGVTTGPQSEKIERAFDKLIRNVYKYIAQVWNADAVTVTPLGQGVEALQKTTLYEQAIANVAMASGMPLSLLLANSATFATAVEEKKTWFNNKIVPDAKRLQSILNREVFDAYGVRFEFRYEASDEGQEEEVARANALSAYVNAGMRLGVAAEILGIELPDDMDYDKLDQMREEDKEKAREAFEKQQANKPAPFTPKQQERPPAPPVRTLSLDHLKELQVWRDVALRRNKKGESLTFDYLPHYGGLPEDITEQVKYNLANATTDMEEIKACFDVEDYLNSGETKVITETSTDNEIKVLADALNRAADVTMEQTMGNQVIIDTTGKALEPQERGMAELARAIKLLAMRESADPVITVNVPETKVTFNVPEQPAPIVNFIANEPDESDDVVKAIRKLANEK